MEIRMPSSLRHICLLTATVLPFATQGRAQVATDMVKMPHLESREGRHALIVDDKPYLMLGAQINNSSSWAGTLPEVWPALEALHVNTVEAPVYWEQMEPQEGTFDFSTVDLLLDGARQHHLRLVLLWFGTWKNGQNHYVPEWIKTNPARFPREQNADGKLLDVMSPHAAANLQADERAFAALMHHLRSIDGTQHTVIMMQVENESGAIGTVRDHSPEADKEFAKSVPAVLHQSGTSWSAAYGSAADERFAAYATAHYINAVAAAGKAEYFLPMYCNVWITYPVHALANRDNPSAGQEYPSGGPQQDNIAIWKAAAPSIDLLGPDFYSDDRALFREVVAAYARPDNALFIPETHIAPDFGPNLFFALGHGAIGFSPFGIDFTGWTTLPGNKVPAYLSENFALLAPMQMQLAQLNFEGKLQTAVEQTGQPRTHLHFPAQAGAAAVDAIVAFGFPQRDGEAPPGTEDITGRALVARLGPLEFLVTGFHASVSFEPASATTKGDQQLEILRAEQGTYLNGVWQPSRIWNGDQTDRGLQFPAGNKNIVQVRLGSLPLHLP